jgi:hypothetical protein
MYNDKCEKGSVKFEIIDERLGTRPEGVGTERLVSPKF